MATDDDPSGTPKTFTQADLDRAAAAGAQRARAAAAEKYGDYEDLKAKAASAEASASQLDRIEQQLKAAEGRAAKAERETLTRRVADDLGIPMRLAGRLNGNSYDELIADGRETMDELGIKPRKANAKAAPKGEVTEGEESADEDENAQQDGNEGEAEVTPPAPTRARPRESFRSGAPRTPSAPEETNPLKLAEMIPRR